MERFRKDAKALLKAHRAGDAAAVARAEAVLGERARERFQLSDAQHVVAREQGHRSWRELAGRTEKVVDTGLTYDGERPVSIRVRRRGTWFHLDDEARAVELAGRPRGWLPVAERTVREEGMNVNRRGVVFVGATVGRDIDALIRRLGQSSLDVYVALLELED